MERTLLTHGPWLPADAVRLRIETGDGPVWLRPKEGRGASGHRAQGSLRPLTGL